MRGKREKSKPNKSAITNYISIKGARQHNLKSININIPRDRLVVITGVSGSGKSSLAFDTIYAEGQRRYIESLSSYARQFLDQMQKPEVDIIKGLPPTIAIEQRTSNTGPIPPLPQQQRYTTTCASSLQKQARPIAIIAVQKSQGKP